MAHGQQEESFEHQQTPCSEAVLTNLSKIIGKDIKKLGRSMGIHEATLENIEIDESKWGNEEVAFKTMEVWKRLQGNDATEEKLFAHLDEIGRRDIAREILTVPSSMKTVKDKTGEGSLFKSYSNCKPLTLKKIQSNLRKRYKTLQMKGLPWMKNVRLSLEKHFVQLEMVNEKGKDADRPSHKIELDELFKKSTPWFGKRPSRILVEGGAGFGKTTLAAKLCYDYCNQQSYLKHFDIVLFSSLRYFVGSIKEMLCNAAFVPEEHGDMLLKLISSKAVKTLLVLDGYDELPIQTVDSIQSLIRGEILPHVSVLVTSRPGALSSTTNTTNNDNFNMSEEISFDIMETWDIYAKIIGINENRQAEFIDKHLSNISSDEREAIAKQIAEMRKNNILTTEFLQCPLFILMIVLLLTETKTTDLDYLKNKTDLYKRVMNFVVRRYLSKNAYSFASAADLFSFDNSQRPFYSDLIAQLGEFSLTALQSDSLTFSIQDVLGQESTKDKRILDVGILIRNLTVRGIIENESYEPVHKTLVEFAAAYFLWIQYISGKRDRWKESIIRFRPSPTTAGSSLVFPFLIGLMGKDATDIFDALRPYTSEYSVRFDLIIPMLSEMELTPAVLSSLSAYLPFRWVNYWSYTGLHSSSIPSEVMAEGIKLGKISDIWWYLQFPIHFSPDVQVDKLSLFVENQVSPVSNSHFKGIHCGSLLCSFSNVVRIGSKWMDLLSIVAQIQYETISFRFSDSWSTSLFLPLIYDAVIDGPLKDTAIRCVRIAIADDSMLDRINDLVQRDKIEVLWLDLFYLPAKQQLNKLYISISKSSRLTSFMIWHSELHKMTVDVSLLFSESHRKSYEWIRINNCEIEFNQDNHESNYPVKLLELPEVHQAASVTTLLQSCQVTSVFSGAAVLDDDSHLLNDSMIELVIIVGKTFLQQEYYSRLNRFSNLQFLTFALIPCKYPISSVVRWFSESIVHLHLLKGISIDRVESNFPLAQGIVKELLRHLETRRPLSSLLERTVLCPDGTHPGRKAFSLQYVTIYSEINPDINDPNPSTVSDFNQFLSLITPFKQSLNEKVLGRLDVCVYYSSFLHYMSKFQPNGLSSVVELFPPEEKFAVLYDYRGMREDDSPRNKMFFTMLSFLFNRFSVTAE